MKFGTPPSQKKFHDDWYYNEEQTRAYRANDKQEMLTDRLFTSYKVPQLSNIFKKKCYCYDHTAPRKRS